MNYLKKLFSVSAYLTVGASLLTGGDAMAGTLISSTVYDGDTSQGLSNVIINGTQLVDGDFTITANQGNPAFTRLGDGVDETIRWDFDFSGDPALSNFLAAIDSGKKLKTASITYTLTNNGVFTDGTGIPGSDGKRLAARTIPRTQIGNFGDKVTFTLDLFDPLYGFTSNIILDNLDRSDNTIPWLWQDDVIMHSATLTLETVPEPATILGLLALSTVGASVIKRNKESA